MLNPFGALAASNIAPGDIVIHMDVMYADNAGAVIGHMGVHMFWPNHYQTVDNKKGHPLLRMTFSII